MFSITICSLFIVGGFSTVSMKSTKIEINHSPLINITVPYLSIITIKANITNPIGYDATYANWKINISWGPSQKLWKTIANGTIERIKNGDSVIVQTEQYFFGFGLINVMISVIPENIPSRIKTFDGFKLGPLIFLSQKNINQELGMVSLSPR